MKIIERDFFTFTENFSLRNTFGVISVIVVAFGVIIAVVVVAIFVFIIEDASFEVIN